MSPRLLLAAAVVVVLGGGIALVTANRGAVGEDSRWRPVLVGVCRAAEEAADGQDQRAENAFRDVHEDIHELIIEAGRDAGGPLARDKFRVERELDGAEGSAADSLRTLVGSIRTAGVAAGDDPGSCP